MCSMMFVALRLSYSKGTSKVLSLGSDRTADVFRRLRHRWLRWRGRRIKPLSPNAVIVQELDGGFFEKFGTLLREQEAEDTKEVQEDSKDKEAEEVVSEEETEVLPPDQGDIISSALLNSQHTNKRIVYRQSLSVDGKKNERMPKLVRWPPEPMWAASEVELIPMKTAGPGAASPLKGSVMRDAKGKPLSQFRGVKKDVLQRQASLLVQAMTIEELYSEILYEILHIIGSDASLIQEQDTLFGYLQEAFKVDQENHSAMLEAAKEKEAPNILLNVEVVEGKELTPKDANGLSDPFCTLYISSAPTHRYTTSVKTQTLSPVWEEHFSLPVENTPDDVLYLEVWDFDPAETVREKMTKIGDVKGVKGLTKLMKEIAVTASTGKHDNEFIGTATVPLKSIPAGGQTVWCNLERKSKVKRQGLVKVKVSFSSEKNSHVAAQEHRHLLRILLLHELEQNKTEAFKWKGEFSRPAATLVRQHLAQSGLGATDDALAQWVEFATVHTTHPLSFHLFADLVRRLLQPINTGLLSDEEIKLFWDGAKKLLPSCFNSIKKIRKLTPGETSTTLHLQSLLTRCLFRFQYVVEHNKPTEDSDEARLKHLIKVIQVVRTDLQRAIDFYDKLFGQIMLLPYSRTLYIIYDNRVSELTEPVVTDLCMSLKPIKYNENDVPIKDETSDSILLAIGTTLFELYLGLRRFAVLAQGLCPADLEGLHTQKCHLWFHRGVAQWLDIAVYKAMKRIAKAVELDQLQPIDANVQYSSSPIDTLTIFNQIKVFWQQLAWPDVEGSYTFVAKIMDDICRCCVYYADIMSKKVDNMGETETVYEKKFEVTNEWCYAINNIDYVRLSIKSFMNDLGVDEIIKQLAVFRSPNAAEHCRETLQLVIDNAIDTVKNKILDLLEVVAVKMTPSISRFLVEGAELLNQENNSVDRLMMYLDNSLCTLHSQLNPENFERILSIIWTKLAQIMYNLVESSLEKRRPPSFFANLHEMLKMMVRDIFRADSGPTASLLANSEVMANIEQLLVLQGMETWQLIHQCHLERHNEQQELIGATAPLGMLTVRMQFVHDLLRIEIMNARNLRPMDDNGLCDPYVKVHVIPEEKFTGITRPRTKTHKKTLFPLFDEIFSIQLSREQREMKDAMVHFLIKDQDFLGVSSDFVAEAYFPFSGIPATTMETRLDEMTQIHLKLTKPSRMDSPAMKTLDHRQGEKLAKDFIKKQKIKANTKSHVTNGNH
ncbi:protein unc-13 homolog 4B [Nilaparvata lugens]|uniref:protein unc-13 homolog 4B n=1 Tax=Nilaparvata lugens TaxID=108931 RepID=UPI00193E692A|nr:protein unc-13 homolog 4B [Nilaparvata lugens]